MSNAFMTGEYLATVAVTLAAEDLGLAQHVYRDVAAGFAPGRGKTVSISVPGVTTTSTRPVGSTDNYVLGEIAESKIDVTLTTEAYSVVPITLAEASLDVGNYAKQVLDPQARTVAQRIESSVAGAFAATPVDATVTYDPAKPHGAFIRARAALRSRGVSADTPLKAVVGAQVYADLLLAEKIDDAGRVAGIPVYENSAVPADALYVFIKNAFVAAIRAPQPPEGATYAASVAENGMALTHMRAFNAANGVTNSIVTTFVGVAPLPLPVADYEAGTVTLVEGGGIVSVDTAGA